MRRSIKKAVAFTLAAVTMFANLSITSPVKAAEYGEVKEVLPNEYEKYYQVGDKALFYDTTKVANEDKPTDFALDKVSLVDKNGEVTKVNVKNADGTYKYVGVSPFSDKAVIMTRQDGGMALYYGDGTWFGDGKDKYTGVVEAADGNYFVKQDGKWNIVDKSGKLLGQNVFEFDEYGEWIEKSYKVGDYLIVVIPFMGAGTPKLVFLDKDYKQKSNVIFTESAYVEVVDNNLLAWDYEQITWYNSKFEEKFTYKDEDVENPSPSAENTSVDYDISHVEVYEEAGVFAIELSYKNPYDISMYETVYFDLKNFKQLSEDEVADLQKREYTILNSDLVCKDDRTGTSYYYGTKKVADYDSIVKYVEKNKGVEGCSYYALYVYNGDVYFDINSYSTDYTLVLEKASGYSLEKAKILDKGLSDGYNELGGCIVFDDGTAYFNGKVYEKYTDISYMYSYNQVELESYVSNYVISKTEYKDDKCETVNTLYDKNHTEIYKTKDNIEYAFSNGIIVIGVEDEKEGYKYGCKYVKKTLVNSQDILDELVTAEEGDTIEVEIKKNDPVKAEVFETIKGKDVNVVLNLDNGMSWKINGKNVKGSKLTDINLTVDVVKDV
ncbi:MAG: hypothetical protein II243_04845, partial [Lachnospiraceae bacterium]|nr:hypothetical protein [Lachnospiraceae bacterium]